GQQAPGRGRRVPGRRHRDEWPQKMDRRAQDSQAHALLPPRRAAAAEPLDPDPRSPRTSSRAIPRVVEEAMSARDEILARVRTALGEQPVGGVTRDYRVATDDGLDTFLDRLAHYE